ncbi:unnamed protein product [Trichogramma brassicae]|uniref:Uncharacterized protein n=1 Tax=Trichogramma brassicae TaxID=86971 RepID=A0A6H5I6A9_9HYME|nr:unnamed protein product [Trichogramma brassicae]
MIFRASEKASSSICSRYPRDLFLVISKRQRVTYYIVFFTFTGHRLGHRGGHEAHGQSRRAAGRVDGQRQRRDAAGRQRGYRNDTRGGLGGAEARGGAGRPRGCQARGCSGGGCEKGSGKRQTHHGCTIKKKPKSNADLIWPGLPATLPSPASPSAVIVSPETLSRHSSSSPTRGSGGGVVGTGCGGGTTGTTGSTNSTERALNNTGTTSQASNYQQHHHHHHHDHHSQHHHQSQMGNDTLKSDLNSQQSQPLLPQYALALCQNQQQQSMIPAVCYPVPNYLELEVTTDRHYKHSGCDAFSTTLSALYGKLLVVMGIAFPMAEVISTYIPPSFYEAFYLYLYIGSMLFLVIMYLVTCTCCKSKNRGGPRLVAIVERPRRRQRQSRARRRRRRRRHRRRQPGPAAAQARPALRQLLPAHGRGGLRRRLDDLLGPRVRPVLRARAQHQVPQHHAGPDPGHQDGVHLHTDVLYLSQRQANEGLQSQDAVALRAHAHDRHESLGLAQRPDPGDQARDPHLLQSREQHLEDLAQARYESRPHTFEQRRHRHGPRASRRRGASLATAARPQGPASHVRVPAHQHHGLARPGRQPLPLSLHHRVQSHLRGHTLRHVEEHLQDVAEQQAAHAARGCCGSGGGSTSQPRLQTLAPSLQRGLRRCPQGSVPGHSHPRADHHLAHPVLRADVATRARQSGRDRGQHLRADPVRHVDPGHPRRHVSHAQVALRRQPQPRARQHTARGRADRHVHLLDLHDNRQPLHPGEAHGARADHGAGERRPDHLPDHLHSGRLEALRGDGRPHEAQTRPRDSHVPAGDQSRHVGHQHTGEVQGRVASRAAALLRPVGLDHHHSRIYALGYLL